MSLLALVILSSCTPDQVNPQNGATLQGKRTAPESAESLSPSSPYHIALLPLCGSLDSTNLVTSGGVTNVNYCGFTPCTGPTPEWGMASYMYGETPTGDNGFELNIEMAPNWYVKRGFVKLGAAADFTLQNGIPQIDATWSVKDVTPINTCHWQFDMDNMPQDFFVACKLEIGMLDFFNGWDNLSETEVWIFNSGFAGANPSPSAFLNPYSAIPCSNSAVRDGIN